MSEHINVLVITTKILIFHSHLDGSICQGGVAGGVIIGPRPSYGPEGGDKVEVMEPEKGFFNQGNTRLVRLQRGEIARTVDKKTKKHKRARKGVNWTR